MKTKNIELNEKTYSISMLPLGKYAELVGALKSIPEIVADVDALEKEAIIGKLPEIVEKAFPELLQVLHIATGIDVDILKNEIGLVQAVEIIEVVFDVNDYEMLGKVLGRLSDKVQANKKKIASGSKK